MKEKLAFTALQVLAKLQLKSYELEDWLYREAFPASKSPLVEQIAKSVGEIPLSAILAASIFSNPEDIPEKMMPWLANTLLDRERED